METCDSINAANLKRGKRGRGGMQSENSVDMLVRITVHILPYTAVKAHKVRCEGSQIWKGRMHSSIITLNTGWNITLSPNKGLLWANEGVKSREHIERQDYCWRDNRTADQSRDWEF